MPGLYPIGMHRWLAGLLMVCVLVVDLALLPALSAAPVAVAAESGENDPLDVLPENASEPSSEGESEPPSEDASDGADAAALDDRDHLTPVGEHALSANTGHRPLDGVRDVPDAPPRR